MTEVVAPARHITLDALRGFAVMGILAMNIIAFAMPEIGAISPAAYSDSLGDRISWFFSFVFIEGKMRGLFSLLFGASMMLIIDRAEAKGENPAKVHYSRMFWLAIFGLAHYFLLWHGDILFTYAIIGCLAYLFSIWEPKRLILWALMIFAVGLLMWGGVLGGMHFLQWSANLPGADANMAREYKEAMAGLASATDIQKELINHRGSWAGIITKKMASPFDPLASALQGLTETLPLMMLGMAMMKNGFLTGQWPTADYRRWIWRLMPVAIMISTALAALCWQQDFELLLAMSTYQAWGIFPRLMMTIAYAAALILLIRAMAGSTLLARIVAAGRAAFTNYLGTSIVMTTLFYGYGLGLYGHVSRPILWVFVLAGCAGMLLWSKPWLERFHYGPLEWLWRSLARFEVQPWRKSKAA